MHPDMDTTPTTTARPEGRETILDPATDPLLIVDNNIEPPLPGQCDDVNQATIELEEAVMQLDKALKQFPHPPESLDYNLGGTLHVNVCSLLRTLREVRDGLESARGYRR